MKSIVSFACVLLVIACTTVRPSDTRKHGGGHPPHNMGFAEEEIDYMYSCAANLTEDDSSHEARGRFAASHKFHVYMTICGLQLKGVLNDDCKINRDALNSFAEGALP